MLKFNLLFLKNVKCYWFIVEIVWKKKKKCWWRRGWWWWLEENVGNEDLIIDCENVIKVKCSLKNN